MIDPKTDTSLGQTQVNPRGKDQPMGEAQLFGLPPVGTARFLILSRRT